MSIPLSLYIHIPWCIRKCPYCDFNSHAVRDGIPENEYIAKLIVDLQRHKDHWQNRKIHSIFIGGGTPSLLSVAAYKKLFEALYFYLDIPPEIEITLESNPGASEQERFIGYRETGINRLSIGVQSWNAKKLKILGRIHDDHQAEQAVLMAKQAGFTNFNIDIMHGLPEQTFEEAMIDLEHTLACKPTHISWYQLTLEPNTFFNRFPPALPDEEMIFDIQDKGRSKLDSAGYHQYEVSAYCREDYQSQHNLNYWNFGDYIGIGAGAHSKITLQDGAIWRGWKVKNPKDYLGLEKILDGESIIPCKEILFEFLLNSLRLRKKIPFSLIIERTGLKKDEIVAQIKKADSPELIITQDTIELTQLGYRFLNQILTRFF